MTRELADHRGERFGRLVIETRAGANIRRAALWLCRCDCGGSRTTTLGALRSGRTVSCGCWHREAMIKTHSKHGNASRSAPSKLYKVWQTMKQRCLNPSDKNYHRYGGRGVTICARWAESFEAFASDVGTPPEGKREIDRIDNNKSYEPGNIRWADRTDQMRNTSICRPVIRGDGKKYGTIIEASEDTGVSHHSISATCRGRQRTGGGFVWRYADPAFLKAHKEQHDG